MTIIEKQKYDLAKFLRLIFLVPPNENTSSRIKPIKGIENKIYSIKNLSTISVDR